MTRPHKHLIVSNMHLCHKTCGVLCITQYISWQWQWVLESIQSSSSLIGLNYSLFQLHKVSDHRFQGLSQSFLSTGLYVTSCLGTCKSTMRSTWDFQSFLYSFILSTTDGILRCLLISTFQRWSLKLHPPTVFKNFISTGP